MASKMLLNWQWYLEIFAAIASILGAILSGIAAFQARRASTAARQAKNAVFLSNLTHEMDDTCKKLEAVVIYLKNGHVAEAGLTAMELTAVLSELPYRHENLLSPEAKDKMHTAREQVRDLAKVARDAVIGPEKRRRMIEIVHTASVNLREELAKVKSKLEVGLKS